MHIHLYLSIYLSTYLSIYLSIYLLIYLSLYLSVYLSIYLSLYTYIYIYIHVHTPIIIYIYIYMYIYIYIHIYIYIYIYPVRTTCFDRRQNPKPLKLKSPRPLELIYTSTGLYAPEFGEGLGEPRNAQHRHIPEPPLLLRTAEIPSGEVVNASPVAGTLLRARLMEGVRE